MKMLEEFKEFALRGNVIDLAVGVVIGGAFGRIVTSLVNDVLMPPIGILTGGVDFSDKRVVLKPAEGTEPAVTLAYGSFINNVIDFVIVAIAIFMVIKAINTARRQASRLNPSARGDQPVSAAEPAPTRDQELLSEIRDLLKTSRP